MKFIYKTLVYSNLWAGLAVASFCFITLEHVYTLPSAFFWFVLAATAFTYSYIRLVQFSGDGYNRQEDLGLNGWSQRHPALLWGYTLFFGIATTIIFREIYSPELIMWLVFPVLVSGMYPVSFKNPFSGFTSLRTFPGLKMFLISFTWSYVTVLIPHGVYGEITAETWFEFIFRAILLLGLVIPFDIRDEVMDEPAMRTLPQVMGADKAKSLALFCVAVYQLWLVARFYFFDFSLVSTLALIIGFEIGFLLIRGSGLHRKEHYYSFWLEATPIFAALLLVLAQWLF